MKPIFIKIIIRALATLGTVLGLSMIFFGIVVFLPNAITSGDGLSIGIRLGIFVFSILFGIYLCGVGFFAWFGLSPVAVRHVLGTLAFMLFGMLGRAWDHFRSVSSPEVVAIYFPIGGLLIYILYRCVASYCCNRLFPIPLPDANAPIRNAS